MPDAPPKTKNRKPIPLHAVPASGLAAFLKSLPARDAAFVRAAGFSAREGETLLVQSGGVAVFALYGLGDGADALALGDAAQSLPPGDYILGDYMLAGGGDTAHLAFALGAYAFTRYRVKPAPRARLIPPRGADARAVARVRDAVFLARDLINTPANDMGPDDLAAAARALARRYRAQVSVIRGNALRTKNYPLIHAVGMGSSRPPCLIDLRWGARANPRVTLVGKGVCFDSGGYDIKPSAAMLMMKKDMGGAATVLAIARMVMDAKLPVRLRVLIPAVENMVSGNAMRPGDVYASRKGLTVEIGNTDAEGRLVLADALAEADAESPDLLIDIATLTGAARVATGTQLSPFFTDDEKLAADLSRASMAAHDPLWRLPLWRGYENTLKSALADLNNNPDYGFAGAITAALFLNRFVTRAKSWAHLDIYGWNDRARPGRPRGGEANGARAIFALLSARYGR